MKSWLFRILFVLSLLAAVLVGSWWVWRTWIAPGQLQTAVDREDTDRLQLLVKLGASPNTEIAFDIFQRSRAKPRRGYTMLHWASWTGQEDFVRFLLTRAADVHARDSQGMTPLHYAVLPEALAAQITAFTIPFMPDHITPEGAPVPGSKPACRDSPYHEISRLLLEAGADPNAAEADGATPISLWPELAEIVKKVEAEKAAKSANPKDPTP